jgi:single-strand DNA-binding protein
MNKFIGIGRLTKDPEVRITTSGNNVATFTIAIDRFGAKEKATDFINCVAWNKTAENLANYCGKGSQVAVDGSVQVRTYEKDGSKRYITEIMCNRVQFLTPKSQSNDSQVNQSSIYSEDEIPF